MKYSLIALALLSSCGAAQSISKDPLPTAKIGGGSNSPSLISVSLNDAFTTVAPNGSEKVQINDARYFTAPTSITVVQGSYTGSNPGQYLHGKLLVGDEVCEYQANGINVTVLSLQFCSGGIGVSTYLPASTVIELVNHDAPGFLLEANFNLVR